MASPDLTPFTDALLRHAHDHVHAMHTATDPELLTAEAMLALSAYLQLDNALRAGGPLPTKWMTAQLLRHVPRPGTPEETPHGQGA